MLMLLNAITLSRLIPSSVCIALLASSAAAQPTTPIDPITRLSVTGAIQCSSDWSREPKQYEIFEINRQTLVLVGNLARAGRVGNANEAENAELDKLSNQEKALNLNSYVADSIGKCIEREIDRMISLVGKVPNP